MISTVCNFSAFVDSIQGLDRQEMIVRTIHEATSAERVFYKISPGTRESSGSHASFQYAILLKDLTTYIRHGVMTPRLKNLDAGIQGQLATFGIPR